ncbi:ABC transporter permease [Microbacterium gorillae]|uniref:ABC transporter permease n=1 Tax=Microbacterium gorillae TaxID=1231063 RepID=UPI00058DA721|nr:ABC transporter permease [Microbacterium gorillae]
MLRYAIRRILLMIPTLIGSTLLVYLLVFLIPGDPVLALAGDKRLSASTIASIRAQYNLDDPFFVQYIKYLGNVLHGDFGRDFNGNAVSTLIGTALPYTVVLALSAFVLKIVIGVCLGVWAGMNQGKFPDKFNLIFTIFFLAVPGFIIAYFAQYIFGIKLHLLPISGVRTGFPMAFIMPALVLALETASPLARLTRTSLVDVLRSDYIVTARAKGLAPGRIMWVHALRNALMPVVTYLGLSLASLLGGSVLIETIFNLPGLGGTLARAIDGMNGPVVVGVSVFLLLFYLVAALVVDLLYPIIDPRVRHV